MVNKRGFTYIELAIVLAVIFILAVFSVPRFTDLFRRAQENETRIALTMLKNAIRSYYEQHGGMFPASLNDEKFLGKGKYIEKLPTVKIGKIHRATNEVKINGEIDDFGGWYYNSETGEVRVNCKHKDTSGQEISKW